MFNNSLKVMEDKPYFIKDNKPFFWLADTAWLIFANLTKEEAYIFLKNRADKGYNVIQAVLIYATEGMKDINKMPTKRYDCHKESYWQHVEEIIDMAKDLGLYMALVPTWGSLVKKDILNMDNLEEYINFLADRFGKKENVIWLIGGDIKAGPYVDLYNKMGRLFKEKNPDKLIGFHPFGRCSSSLWFKDADWLDFNMFQSGHRRYDQCQMGAWDDTSNQLSLFGEDNWRYVEFDHASSNRPTLDGEPSYEQILQGLHDDTQPYWQSREVRRYAYWSVFAGAAGHTYGDCSIIMFYDGSIDGVVYGAKDYWQKAMHHEGSGQMKHLKDLMESVDFTSGESRDDYLIEGQREKHDRIAVFASDDFLFAYNYLGKSYKLDTSAYIGKDIYYFNPATGIYSYIDKVKTDIYQYEQIPDYNGNIDAVLVIK